MKPDGKKALLILPVLIFGADWMLKRRIDKTMEPGEERAICGGRLILRKQYNNGAAFGLFGCCPKAVTAVHGSLLAALAACYAMLLKEPGRTGMKLSTAMLLGGGLSNFWDRLVKRHVVDYLSLPAKCKCIKKIVFNLSDLFVFAGAAMNLLFANLAKTSKKHFSNTL